MPGARKPAVPEDAFAAESERHALLRRRAAVVRTSLKKFLRRCVGAVTDGPTTEERWRIDNGETWQPAHDGDD